MRIGQLARRAMVAAQVETYVGEPSPRATSMKLRPAPPSLVVVDRLSRVAEGGEPAAMRLEQCRDELRAGADEILYLVDEDVTH